MDVQQLWLLHNWLIRVPEMALERVSAPTHRSTLRPRTSFKAAVNDLNPGMAITRLNLVLFISSRGRQMTAN